MGISQYDPIWDELKSKKQVSLSANRALHPRIIKAVKKRKNLDLGYKLQIDPRKAVLSHTRKNSVLTLYLTLTITADDL